MTLLSLQLILYLNIRQTTVKVFRNTSKPTMLKSCHTKMLLCIVSSQILTLLYRTSSQ